MKMPKVTLTRNTKIAIGVVVITALGGLMYYYYARPTGTMPTASNVTKSTTYVSPGLPTPVTANSGAKVTQPPKPSGVRFQGTWGWYDQ